MLMSENGSVVAIHGRTPRGRLIGFALWRAVGTEVISALALGPPSSLHAVTHDRCEGTDREVLIRIEDNESGLLQTMVETIPSGVVRSIS